MPGSSTKTRICVILRYARPRTPEPGVSCTASKLYGRVSHFDVAAKDLHGAAPHGNAAVPMPGDKEVSPLQAHAQLLVPAGTPRQHRRNRHGRRAVPQASVSPLPRSQTRI